MVTFYKILVVILSIAVLFESYFLIKRIIQKISHKNVRLKMAHLTEKIYENKEPEEFYKYFTEMVFSMFPRTDEISIEIQDEDIPENFKFVSQIGYSEKIIGLSIPKCEFELYKLNQFKKSAIILNPPELNDLKLDKVVKEKKNLEKITLKEMIVAPIYSFNSIYGLITLGAFKKNSFKKRDVELIEYVNDEINFIIEYFKMISEKSRVIDYDQLTTLSSRFKFLDVLEELAKNNEKQESYVFVIIDLDNFKSVNDTYGHIVGDKTLRYFSDKIKQNISESTVCGRYGGDEFGLIFKSDNPEFVHEKLINMREDLKNSTSPDGLTLTFTYGLFPFKSDGRFTTSQIIEKADKTLYIHKDIRKNGGV
jgi:diguanylate cyclase (GGDEF)-like protein